MIKHLVKFICFSILCFLILGCSNNSPVDNGGIPNTDPPAPIEEPLEMKISVSTANREGKLSEITPTVTYTLKIIFNKKVKNVNNKQIIVSFNELISYEIKPVYYSNGADEPFGNSDSSTSYIYYFYIEETSENTCELSVEYEELKESCTLGILHNNVDGYLLSYGSTNLYYGYGKLRDDDTKYLLFEDALSFHDYINSSVSSVSDTIFEKYNLLAIKIFVSSDTKSVDFSSCYVENDESIIQIEEAQKSVVSHWNYSETVAWIAIEKDIPSNFTTNIYYSYL